jgi:N6-adenosine-specific RNA methylase IME4
VKTQKYNVAVIDPPWSMRKIVRKCRPNQTENLDYHTQTIPEIANTVATNILPSLNPDAHVFLWTTQKFLPAAFELLKSWGLKYVCTMTWHKPGGFQPYGLPQYNSEFCLYARRGAPKFVNTKKFFTCFNAPRGRHSEKPEEFYDLLRRVTDGHRLDVYNRRVIEGFDAWGDEANGNNQPV